MTKIETDQSEALIDLGDAREETRGAGGQQFDDVPANGLKYNIALSAD